MKAFSSLAPLILRVTLGVIFLAHGIGKFEHIDRVVQLLTHIGVSYTAYVAPALALLEVVGGACLILGIGTRIFALLLAMTTAVAILKIKLNLGLQNGYEFELLLFASLLSLVLSGPGAFSLSRQRAQRGAPKQDLPRQPQLQ